MMGLFKNKDQININMNRTTEEREWLDKQMALIKKAQEGCKESMDQVIQDNIGIIWSAVRKFPSHKSEMEDLFQVGAEGFIKAVNKFDTTRDVALTTYLYPAAYGSIANYVRDNAVVGKTKVRRKIRHLAISIRDQELSDKPIEEIQEILEEKDYANVVSALEFLNHSFGMQSSTDAIIPNSKGETPITLGDMLEGDVNSDWELNLTLRLAVDRLNDRSRQVIQYLYFDELTQAETSKLMGVSQPQVNRIKAKAVKELKTILEGAVA